MVQEALTLATVLFAAGYMFRRLTGWPPRRKRPGEGVILGARLSKGLASARSKPECCE